MDRALSAPGKLFVAGEYAVLWGGVARVLAVGPRGLSLVRQRADREVRVLLDAGRLQGTVTPAGVRWSGPVPDAFHFVALALDEAVRARGKEAQGFTLALSSSPRHQGEKLGLGGSARATVLATAAARWALGDSSDALKLSLLSHSLGQGGRGSGGDVAACFAGGLCRYERYDVSALARASSAVQLSSALSVSPPVSLLRLPVPTLFATYAFTGQAASTRSLIDEVEQRVQGMGREEFVRRSNEAGVLLEDGLTQREFQKTKDACESLQALLSGLAAIATEETQRIIALARALGSTGKMSGAGGGDGCILFSPDQDGQKKLIDSLAARGVLAFPVSPETGLRTDSVADPTLRAWVDAES